MPLEVAVLKNLRRTFFGAALKRVVLIRICVAYLLTFGQSRNRLQSVRHECIIRTVRG